MGIDGSLPSGWTVWSDEDDRLVLAYRPDVFNGSDYPAACLPTIYVRQGERGRRPGDAHGRELPADAPWTVTLYLEPAVNREAERFDSQAAAREAAIALADRFARGDVDYRGLYQVPRETYFARLDELTGQPE